MAEGKQPKVGELRNEIGSLGADLREMAALRWELARLELRDAIGHLKRLAIVLPIAAVMTLTALPILAVAAAEGLGDWLGVGRVGWLLIFGVGLLAGGAATGYLAWRRFRRRYAGIEQTLEEFREDVAWLGEWAGSTTANRDD